MVRVGFAGSGFAARFQYNSVRRVHGVPVEVAGSYSIDTAELERFCAERKIRAFDSLEALCDAVDVVSVCTPPSTHEPIAVEVLGRGRHVIVEKPFTGLFDWGRGPFTEAHLEAAVESAARMLEAAQTAPRSATGAPPQIFYAENWVYAPAVQKEREIMVKSGGQVLWMMGGCSHSGSHSPSYGIRDFAGGGSLVGKGCHPLTAALFLKAEEGMARGGNSIRPASISCRTHELTKIPSFGDLGHIRRDYKDIEDYSQAHLTFSDGTVADVFAAEVVLGGVDNWLEVFANNHRTRCNLNPIDAVTTYNAQEEYLRDVYVVEKTGTKQGWSHPAPDENWMHGYDQEMQDFVECAATGRRPMSGAQLGFDTVVVMYSAYLSAARSGAEVCVTRELSH